ncbi:MAG TPA: transporter substrate-binding domain-containing protein [Xanthobacteraceae bacterium]|nr:transporter substrate-binding domain-containing protein [Xanthobacteraceae bacterium]
MTMKARNGSGKFILLFIVGLTWLATPVFAQQAEAPRELVVGVKEAPPFTMKNSDEVWVGLSIELWERIASDLKQKFRYIEAKTVNDLLQGTESGKFDVGVGAITVTAERERRLDFTQPFYTTGLGIAVPTVSNMSWVPVVRAMTSFGFLQAVLGLLGLALFAGFLMWLLERRHNENFGGSLGRGLTSSVWWSTLAMTQRTRADTGPRTVAGRVVGIIWMIASIIAIAVFTAGITSLLTTKQLQGLVHNVDDLRSVRVGTVAGTAAEETLKKMRIKSRNFATAAEGIAAIRRGALDAFVFDRALLAWTVQQGGSPGIQLLDTTFDPQNYALVLPNGSPLRKPATVAQLAATQSNWWQEASFRYLGTK